MDAREVRVVARVVALPGREERLAEVLTELLVPTRIEDGCLEYELHQSLADPRELLFVERWRDEASLEAHLGSAHVARAVALLEGLVAAAPDIRRYRRVQPTSAKP